MPTVHVNNEDIYYEREGAGPALVLVHSLGTSSALWRESIAHWKTSHTVVAIDCRGHGRSSNHGGVTIPAIAQDLGALVEHLQLGVVDVVGISMGGLIATHFRALAPKRVRRIVLADTFARMPEGEKRIGLLRDKLETMDMAEFGKEYAAQTLLPATAAELHEQLAAWVAATSRNAYMQTVESLFSQDGRALMARIDVPALVVIGDQDQRTPLPLSQEILGLLPKARLELIPQAAHLANLDNPVGFHHAVDQFLQGR
jgi:pimeloyl-ACP methyl ester carboxylesterase